MNVGNCGLLKEGDVAADAPLPKRCRRVVDHIATGKTVQITEHLKARCNIYMNVVVILQSVLFLKPLELQAIKRRGKDNCVFQLAYTLCCMCKGVWFHTPLFKLLRFLIYIIYNLSDVQWICDMFISTFGYATGFVSHPSIHVMRF